MAIHHEERQFVMTLMFRNVMSFHVYAMQIANTVNWAGAISGSSCLAMEDMGRMAKNLANFTKLLQCTLQ